MTRASYLFWTALLAAGIATVVVALVPASRNVDALMATTPCMDLRDRAEVDEKKGVQYQSYVDIKISPDLWRERLAKLDRAISAGDLSSDADPICRLLVCTADNSKTDPESRMKFQRSVRDTLGRAIDEVVKADAAKLSENLASVKKDLAAARAEISKRGCDNIQVISATYGGNCSAPRGNATNSLMKECDGKEQCTYRVDYTVLNDPVPGCAKDYAATWRCGFDGQDFTVSVPAEAGTGSIVTLSCEK